MNNLHELSRNPSPYVLPVIPRPLSSEIEEGEHHVIVDLSNLAPGSSSPAQTSETEVVGRELVISLRPEQPSLAREDSGLAPRASKKVDRGIRLEGFPFTKKDSRPTPKALKKGIRVPGRRRVSGAEVEDFVPWFAPISSSSNWSGSNDLLRWDWEDVALFSRLVICPEGIPSQTSS